MMSSRAAHTESAARPLAASPRRAPGPKRPLLGSLIAPGRDPLELFQRMAREYGDIVTFKLAGERAFFINHPQHIRDVLVTNQRNFTKSRGLERAKRLLGEGLLTSEGTAHLSQRRLLQPAFHRERIAGYGAVMVEHAARMRARWEEGSTFDVSKEMMRLTLSIVGKTLFDSEIESNADEVGQALTETMQTFWLFLIPFADLIEKLPIPALRRARTARDRLDALMYKLIADRRATGCDHGDLLSMLIAARDAEEPSASASARGESDASFGETSPKRPTYSSGREGGRSPLSAPPALSDLQVRDQAMTLLLAGHETTANALTWTWYLLSGHPEIESKLQAEIDRTLEGRLPTVADIPKLPYVERVITEALRLYPPAWIVGRRAISDYPIGEYLVPTRAVVFMSPYVMQRDARFFSNPERFDPDRWTPEFKSALPPFAYFPFGGGARRCIGDQFALMELVLVAATVAQQWKLKLVPNHPVVPQPMITLRAKHGMRMTATRRRHS